MKTLLFLLLIAFAFQSCNKCQQCTRLWVYTHYTIKADGTQTDKQSENGPTEIFEVCGGGDIRNAERSITQKQSYYSGNDQIVSEAVGSCNCK